MDAMESAITPASTLRSAINEPDREGVYGIQPRSSFLNEYEASTYPHAYPCLFPCGRGEPGGVNLQAHFSWTMRYADGMFGVIQKRDVARRVALRVGRKSWIKLAGELTYVTAEDFACSMKDEKAKRPIANLAHLQFCPRGVRRSWRRLRLRCRTQLHVPSRAHPLRQQAATRGALVKITFTLRHHHIKEL